MLIGPKMSAIADQHLGSRSHLGASRSPGAIRSRPQWHCRAPSRVSRSSCRSMRSHLAQETPQISASGGVRSNNYLLRQSQQHLVSAKPYLLRPDQEHWGALPFFLRACPFQWSRNGLCYYWSADCRYLHQTPLPGQVVPSMKGALRNAIGWMKIYSILTAN